MKIIKFLFTVIMAVVFNYGIFGQGVVISDDPGASATADESAVLDIQSTSKGMLIPRMTTEQRNSISNAKDGLLVFDITEGSFYLFGQDKWTDLSTPAELWTVENSNVRLTNTAYSLDVGNNISATNITIEADAGASPDDPIFQIKDKTGKPVFIVTSEGVRIYVNDESKGVSGGFAVGKYGIAKGMDVEYFRVDKENGIPFTGVSGGFAVGKYGIAKGMDTTYFSVNKEEGTFVDYGVSGGFAVGKYGIAKGIDSLLFSVKNGEGTFAYVSDGTKGVSGGFAVGKYGIAKGIDKVYLSVGEKNGIPFTGVSGGFAVGKYGIAKEMDTTYFSVNKEEGTFVDYGVSGGFAVGKYGIAKEIDSLLFSVKNGEGTFAYVSDGTKGVSGGFAVGKYGIAKGMDTTYFSVYKENGIPITGVSGGFAVGKYGIAKGMDEIYFKVIEVNGTPVTGVSGGFAVGKYGIAKEMDTTYFSVNKEEGTFVDYGVSGGFAVGKYGIAKEIDSLLFSVKNGEGTFAYVSEGTKGVSGGFAVGKYGIAKGMDTTYFSVLPERTDINYTSDGSGTGLFVNQIGTGAVGNLFNVRKDYFRVGYNMDAIKDKGTFNFGIGNYASEFVYIPPIISSSGSSVDFVSSIRLGASGGSCNSYSFPITGDVENKILKLNISGDLTWQNDDIGASKQSIENTSELQEELDILKKENAQLRKDIEEIKELLKK